MVASLSGRVDDFDYELPAELIAQEPAACRTASRLLVVERTTGRFEHRAFADLPEYLRAGDALVVNETRVRPARLRGRKTTGAQVELLLLEEVAPDDWRALAKPAKRLPPGSRVIFGEDLRGEILEAGEGGERIVRLTADRSVSAVVAAVGEVPLPPYIQKFEQDLGRYQTVYAAMAGSAAAPTAGLHFTEELLGDLQAAGVRLVKVSLDIGLDTFRPLSVEYLNEHRMHSEGYEISEDAARALTETRAAGGRIVAIGTTTVRALESWARPPVERRPGRHRTDIFIRPGFEFQLTDVMLTNFHLPRSTLIVMVSAFAGSELIRSAYMEAIERRYRFYSFGDAMLLL